MTPVPSLAATAAALPVTGADVVLYLMVAAIVGLTGFLVRRATSRERLSAGRLSTAKKMQ